MMMKPARPAFGRFARPASLGGKVAVLALAAALAGCVSSAPAPAPAPLPTPTPSPTPAPSPTAALAPAVVDWRHAPLAEGDWYWRSAGGNSLAVFQSPAGQAVAQVACQPSARQVLLMVAGAGAGSMTVRTETVEQVLPTSATTTAAVATLAAQDPLLDAIAFSRGRFAIEIEGRALYLPAYPEITRAIEDCR